MTPDQRLCEMVADNPRFLHPMITDDVRAVLAQRDRYEKALRDVHEGAARQLAEPRNHDNDQYALTAIATRVEQALRCE